MRFATMVVVALMASVVVVSAQTTPFIAVYFDRSFQVEAQDPCPGFGVLDTLYIELVNADAFVSGVEFKVEYPPVLGWLADFDQQPATIGTTPTGFSMGWAIPQNGLSSAVDICKVLVQWTCDGCPGPFEIKVVPNPFTSFLGYTDFPDYNLLPAVGMTSLICPTIPTQETTWGKVKSLYGE